MNPLCCLIVVLCLCLLIMCNLEFTNKIGNLEGTLMYSNVFIIVVSTLMIIFTLKLPICDILSNIYCALGILYLSTLNSTYTSINYLGHLVLHILTMWNVKFKKINLRILKERFNRSLMHLCHCLEKIYRKSSQINGLNSRVTCIDDNILIKQVNCLNEEDFELINGCGTEHFEDVLSELPDSLVKEMLKKKKNDDVCLDEGVISEVPMFPVIDESEMGTSTEINDDEKENEKNDEIVFESLDLSEITNSSYCSCSINKQYEDKYLYKEDQIVYLPNTVEATINKDKKTDIHKEISVNSSSLKSSKVNEMYDSSALSMIDLPPLSMDDFEEKQDGSFTKNGSFLRLCTETSINRVSEVDTYVSHVGHCTGHYEDNSIRENKVWWVPNYQIIPITKNDAVYSSDKLSQAFDSNKSEKSNISTISSGCCSIISNKLDVHICQYKCLSSNVHFEESVFSNKGVVDLQKRQANKSINKKYSNGEEYLQKCRKHHDIAKIVKTTLKELAMKRVTEITLTSKCNRKKKKRRISRRKLRRIIFSNRIKSSRSLQIQVRPVEHSPQLITTSSEANTSHPNHNGTILSLQQQISVQSVLPVHNMSNYIRTDGSSDLVTGSSFTTPSVTSSSSWTSYLNSLSMGYEYSVEKKMQYEWLRVQSYQNFPATCHASPLRLARAGFFSTGIIDEVLCFSCGVKYKNWKKKDNPIEVHHRISPDCRMVNGRETTNIPIISVINREAADNPQQEASQRLVIDNLLISGIHQNEDVSIQTTEGATNRSLTREDIQISNDADTTSQSVNRTQQPHIVHHALRPSVVDRNHSVLDGEQNRPAHRDIGEDLGITLERPMYPAYAQLSVRVRTFQGWPGYLDQAPRDMALAGFFYAGYNDYCRCFFCGGGLRDWDAGDDPWVEHARWFSKCSFVRQNKGHRFVEIITKRQAEMEASNNSSDITENHTAVSNYGAIEDRIYINSEETTPTPMTTQSDFLQFTIHQNEDVSIQTTEGAINRSFTREDIQISNDADTTSQSLNRTQQPHVVHHAMRPSVVDRNRSVLDGEQNRTEDKSKAEDLGISLETPKCQDYAQLNDREASNNSSDITENHTAVSNYSAIEDRIYINSEETTPTPMTTQSDFLQLTIHQNEDVSIQTTEGAINRSFTREDIQISNDADTTSQSLNRTQQPHVVHHAMRPSVVDRNRSVLDGEQNRTEDKSKAEDLGISLETPKCQDYAQLNDRQAPNYSSDISENQAAVSSYSEIEERTQINSQETSPTTMVTQSATASISGQASAINDNEGSSLKMQKTKQGKCRTCDANNVPVAFLPCGHIYCCNDCTSAMLKCPMCKVDIKQALKRKVEVSSQRSLQQVEEMQNYICPSEEYTNVQNTQQSVLSNSEPSYEIQQLLGEFHLGNALPITPVHGQLSDDGSSVQRMCDDLPLIIQDSSVSSEFDNTCTIDTPLMIIFYQMHTNQNIYQLFANSVYGIFNFELPNLLSLLRRSDFDDIRRVWSEIIGHRGRRDFYGSDADLVMDPFSSLLLNHYRFNCTNFNCPTNERSFDMPGLTLPQIPKGEVFNVTTFQRLINNFASQLHMPCNEQIVQTVSESREENARYTYVVCGGQLLITRTLIDIPEQPPMIMFDMGQQGLKRRNIGNLNGTVQIGSHRYYIGGLTFASNDHFIGRILLPHIDRTLLYCNGQGLICNEEHQDSRLSLIILFRII